MPDIETPLEANEYQCEVCLNIYERERTDEEALAEMSERFPDEDQSDYGIVCDECYCMLFPQFADDPDNQEQTNV